MSFIHITLYCSELGYIVCIMISEVKVCTTSVLKRGVSWPVEIPSILRAENCAGNWKSICQSELDCLGAHSFIVSYYILYMYNKFMIISNYEHNKVGKKTKTTTTHTRVKTHINFRSHLVMVL